jgi:hypothetical protein
MKKILTLLLGMLLFYSCTNGPFFSAYLVNEYLDFPDGLKRKGFETEVTVRNQAFDSQGDSLVPFSTLGKKKRLYLETFYFIRTYIPIQNVKVVDSLVNELSSVPKRGLIWDNMSHKIYGFTGTIWVNKKIKIKTNQKVEGIMRELSNKLRFKFDNADYNYYHYYDRLYAKKRNNLKNR